MDVYQAIRQRESCRAYDSARPVEDEKLQRLMEAARLAPSASNGQPWRFVAVRNQALLSQLAPLAKGPGFNNFVKEAPCLIAVWEAPSNLSARFGARQKQQDYSSVDIGLAVGQLCLAATAEGLSTCIIGWFDEPGVKALLDIPEAQRLRLIVAVGYAKDQPLRPKVRKPMAEIVRYLDD